MILQSAEAVPVVFLLVEQEGESYGFSHLKRKQENNPGLAGGGGVGWGGGLPSMSDSLGKI